MFGVAETPIKAITEYMSPSNGDFTGYYKELYKIVASSNLVLSKLPAPEGILTAAQEKQITAEAKFLRGFGYFLLARAFGDVPMPLTAYNPDQNTISCTPRAQVFAQAIKDMSESAADLPATYPAVDKGRVTKGAALAYLANAYMYVTDWEKAKAAHDQLFALNLYALAADPQTPFSTKKKNTAEYQAENIFEVQYREKADFNWGSAPEQGHLLEAFTGPRDIGAKFNQWGGWGERLVNIKTANSFEPTDLRRTKMLIKHGESYKGEFMTETLDSPEEWAVNKQTKSAFSTKYWLGPSGNSLSEQNLPQMRYAEVLLNHAEIQFKRNNPTDAYEYINKVRRRANLLDLPVKTDPVAFMQDLMDERRHELLFEPNLWFHYTRTGTAAKFLLDKHGITMDPRWNLFPIPERDRNVNPNLCANGYE
jgi:tetratricopeptide (TPR) repeat protein